MSGGTGEVLTAMEAGLVGCRRCAKVWSMGTGHCGRCGTRLVSRDRKSLQRVWAFWLAGLVCYIPANLSPMLVTRTFFSSQQDTIVGGAIELATHGAIGVAIVVLVASVLIPISKFLAIAFLAISIRQESRVSPHHRHKLYEVVEYIGRWSMIDVFVVAILSALVQFSVLAAIQPGPAAITFALSVIFTMLSAQAFDPKMIWDAQDRGAPAPRPAETPA